MASVGPASEPVPPRRWRNPLPGRLRARPIRPSRPSNLVALDRLLATTGGDTAFLGELIDTYLADTPDQLTAMHLAAESGDVAGLIRPAHSLKTNSANVGAETLSGLCRSIETDARGGAVGDAMARVAAAQAEFEAVRTALLEFRAAQ